MAISGIGASGTLALWQPNTAVPAASPAVSPPPVAATDPIVTITNAAPEPDPTYSSLAAPKLNQVVLGTSATDSISTLMTSNLRASGDYASMLKGIGSALLGRFATTQADFKQTAAVQGSGAGASSNTVSLKIHLASGREVDVSVAFGGEGDATQNNLSVSVHTSGKLTAAEQAAVASLSAGFEAALQGVSRDATKIDLSGLESFDKSKIASVDLKVHGPASPPNTTVSATWNPVQSLDFHADATQRSLTVQSLAGNVSVNVDLSKSAFLGTPAQRQASIQKYLAQFDAANTLGHGNAILVGEFKDAFAQLNSSIPSVSSPSPLLSEQDLSVFSGLDDFQASMSGDFQNDLAGETGHIDYQVSQHTQSQGQDKGNLSVVQTSTANLSAEYAKKRDHADMAKGDYDIFRVNDSSTTTVALQYVKNKLIAATLTTVVSHVDIYEKLVGFKVVDKKDTPSNQSTTQDISGQLR